MTRLLLSPVLGFLLAQVGWPAESLSAAPGAKAGSQTEACQDAVLRNGFTVQNVRPESAGGTTRLWLCAGDGSGYVEVASQQIESLEPVMKRAEAAPPEAPVSPQPASPGSAPDKGQIKTMIASAASRYQLDADFVTSVVKAESGFNPSAVSPKGAKGLMQLMPQTASGLGVKNVLDPTANLDGGTKYLRQLLDQYDGNIVKALTAYNAGPRRVDPFGGVPAIPETRAYIGRIVDDYARKKSQQKAQTAAPAGNR